MKKAVSRSLAGLAILSNVVYAGGGLEGYGVPHNVTFYGGASVGAVEQDGACNVVDNTTDCEHDNSSYKVFAGTRFDPLYNQQALPSLGAEVGYIDFGESNANGEILSERGFSVGAAKVNSQLEASYLAAVGYLPVAPNTEVLGKAGVAYWQQDGKVDVPDDTSRNTDTTNSGLGAIVGLGAQYKVNENISVRGEYEKVLDTAKDTDYSTDGSLYSVGAVFSTL